MRRLYPPNTSRRREAILREEGDKNNREPGSLEQHHSGQHQAGDQEEVMLKNRTVCDATANVGTPMKPSPCAEAFYFVPHQIIAITMYDVITRHDSTACKGRSSMIRRTRARDRRGVYRVMGCGRTSRCHKLG